MAGDALFLGWGQVVRGREQLALQVFQDSIAYYTKLQQDGQIDGFEAFLLAPHSGDLAGFIMMRGEQATLDSILSSPEFQGVVTRAGSVVDNVGVVSAYTGDALAQAMGIFGQVAQDLPQMH
jgi:urease accessory protein UreH